MTRSSRIYIIHSRPHKTDSGGKGPRVLIWVLISGILLFLGPYDVALIFWKLPFSTLIVFLMIGGGGLGMRACCTSWSLSSLSFCVGVVPRENLAVELLVQSWKSNRLFRKRARQMGGSRKQRHIEPLKGMRGHPSPGYATELSGAEQRNLSQQEMTRKFAPAAWGSYGLGFLVCAFLEACTRAYFACSFYGPLSLEVPKMPSSSSTPRATAR